MSLYSMRQNKSKSRFDIIPKFAMKYFSGKISSIKKGYFVQILYMMSNLFFDAFQVYPRHNQVVFLKISCHAKIVNFKSVSSLKMSHISKMKAKFEAVFS